MPSIIPVPVSVSIGLAGQGGTGGVRNFGFFNIVPFTRSRHGEMEILRWFYLDADGEPHEMFEALLFRVMPRKLLEHVCIHTFEADCESLQLVVTIDDERWNFAIRAKELEHEQVHYQVEIEDEWMTITEAFIGDVIGDDQLVFAEREVRPGVDFANTSEVYDQMA